MAISDCCGSEYDEDYGICSECREHCEPEEETEEED